MKRTKLSEKIAKVIEDWDELESSEEMAARILALLDQWVKDKGWEIGKWDDLGMLPMRPATIEEVVSGKARKR